MFHKTRIRICMDEQNIKTLRELSERSGIARPQLSRMLKKHNFTNLTLSRLCDALDCNPGDILVRVPKEEWPHTPSAA